MGQTANSLYGFDPTALQPTATPTPDHLGAPEPSMATTGQHKGADRHQAIVALVVIVAAVVLLTQLSFRGVVQVRA